MKTPEEIKKGLENCTRLGGCVSCPYFVDNTMAQCTPVMAADALAYIQQLEAKLAEYEKPLEPLTNDLISRESVLEALRARGRKLLKLGTSFEANIASVTALECVNIVKDAPAVDAAPVVHGYYGFTGPHIGETYSPYAEHGTCSNCKERILLDPQHKKYCPNCGAKMDEEEA